MQRRESFMNKTCVPLYVSIDSPSALSLYSEDDDGTIASWDGKAPTLDQLNASAQQYCAGKQSGDTHPPNATAASITTCVPLYVSIDSPSALSLYCEQCGDYAGSWDGKAPTLDQLNTAAEQHCGEKHAAQAQTASTGQVQTGDTNQP
jgi:hypothetical protein